MLSILTPVHGARGHCLTPCTPFTTLCRSLASVPLGVKNVNEGDSTESLR